MLQTQTQTAAAELAATLRRAAATLDATATTDLDAAKAELARAALAARARMQAAADYARQAFASLADDAAAFARQLEADLFGPASTTTAPADEVSPAAPAAPQASEAATDQQATRMDVEAQNPQPSGEKIGGCPPCVDCGTRATHRVGGRDLCAPCAVIVPAPPSVPSMAEWEALKAEAEGKAPAADQAKEEEPSGVKVKEEKEEAAPACGKSRGGRGRRRKAG